MTDLLHRLPYARFLGLTTAADGGSLTVTMPFADRLIGNPMLPALHGGSTAALLELRAQTRTRAGRPGAVDDLLEECGVGREVIGVRELLPGAGAQVGLVAGEHHAQCLVDFEDGAVRADEAHADG